jgi:hypothetical protein
MKKFLCECGVERISSKLAGIFPGAVRQALGTVQKNRTEKKVPKKKFFFALE